VVLVFRVMADGAVDPYSIEIRSSTHPAFDDPAALVAEEMRFSPAEVDGWRVAAWVYLPVTFQPLR